MIIFLEKVREKTIFSFFEPIVTEPLELMYIKTILIEEKITSYIIDDKLKLDKPKGAIPNLVILTGYNVAENLIVSKAKAYKNKYPTVKIMVSGVHAQLNREAFRTKGIDYVYFSQSLETFRTFIKTAVDLEIDYEKEDKKDDNKHISNKHINNKEDKSNYFQKGVDIYDKLTDSWQLGQDDVLIKSENISPDRLVFNDIKSQTRYIDKTQVALVKSSHGCPYSCSFCYCRLLNNGIYLKPDYKRLISEIKEIESRYIWVIDDSFFIAREDALDFINNAKNEYLNKSLIIYLRADFIVENEDLMSELKSWGIDEVIVGFESEDESMLSEYNKGQTANIYEKAVNILKNEAIELTALFIVDPAYEIKDFLRLYKYIKKLDLDLYTISIMTPLKGTLDYELRKHELIETDPRKFDFLHLVLKSKLPKWLFYTLFYLCHLRLIKSKRIRKMIRGNYEK
ncbi:B12-binding domain-containing radical SAM protein [Acetoanaerobium noterae]|uniref:B12-binding domain-containing radical SAM protein n=1 Tax=Acetoanaerobium noterae TaxID=745369 RepID=UPI003241F7BA